MTLPIERTWSVKRTREFLFKLLDPKQTPRVPKSVRREALSCLRHFPWEHQMEQVAKQCPSVFGEDDEVSSRNT